MITYLSQKRQGAGLDTHPSANPSKTKGFSEQAGYLLRFCLNTSKHGFPTGCGVSNLLGAKELPARFCKDILVVGSSFGF